MVEQQQGPIVFPEGKPKPDYSKDVTVGDRPLVAAVGQEHPRYRSRMQTDTFKSRWGPEEVAVAGEGTAAAKPAQTAAAPAQEGARVLSMVEQQQGPIVFPEGKPKPDYSKDVTVGDRPLVVVPGQEHPRYRSRGQTETFKSRWGVEEVMRMGEDGAAAAGPVEAEAEEVWSVSSIVAQSGPIVFPEGKPKPDYQKQVTVGETPAVAAPGEEHPRYRSRAETETFQARWGSEEIERMDAEADMAASEASNFMQDYMVQAHETKLRMQMEAKALVKRAEKAEAKAEASEEFMSKYMVDSLATRSALLENLRLAERKVEELEETLQMHQKSMEDMLVKSHLNKMEAVEKAKIDALASYADQLNTIKDTLVKRMKDEK